MKHGRFWLWAVIIILAFNVCALQDARAQVPDTSPSQVLCERFSCLYGHDRTVHTRTGPRTTTEWGIARDLLPDGPDGRWLHTVLWPMVNGSYRADPSRFDAWDAVLRCESRWDWTVKNPRSSASGGFQITNGTWSAYGGMEFASQARWAHPVEQLAVAERILWAGHGRYGPQGARAWECRGAPGRPA